MKHVKLFEEFVNQDSINEKYYIETWYKNDNGEDLQLLGSDGTTVLNSMPKDKDINMHMNRIKSLRKIKPFLVGDVTYKITNGDRVVKTIDSTINEKYQEFETPEEVASYAANKYKLNDLEADTFAFDIEREYVYPITTKEIEAFWKKLTKK